MKIAAYVMIYEKDARYLDSFFANAEMVNVDVGWHLDHCSQETKDKIRNWKHTVFMYEEDNEPYLERYRERPFNGLKRLGYDWLFHWDLDERWDVTADLHRDFAQASATNAKAVRFPMFTAWESPTGLKLRVDTIFKPETFGTQTLRERGYKATQNWVWLDNITVTPYNVPLGNTEPEPYDYWEGKSKIVHYGNVGKDERLRHKEVWDANYIRAIQRQPYHFWELVNDEVNFPPELVDFKKYNLTPQEL
jgi:hypothetical protein